MSGQTHESPLPKPPGANPFADDMNPYASPREAAVMTLPVPGLAAPFAGLWRQGNLLVMHKQAPLPDLCLKSNETATRRLKRSLSWHHPAIYLLILLHLFVYIIVALIVRKTATIEIPLTEEWFARRRQRMMIAWLTIVLCITGFGTAVFFVDQHAWAPLVMLAAVLVGLGAAIYGLLSCRLVWPTRMTDQYIWLKGVHPAFLNRLEVWQWKI